MYGLPFHASEKTTNQQGTCHEQAMVLVGERVRTALVLELEKFLDVSNQSRHSEEGSCSNTHLQHLWYENIEKTFCFWFLRLTMRQN